MFKDRDTGKFSWEVVRKTARIVVTDLLPLAPFYAKTTKGQLVMDTDEVPPNRQNAWHFMSYSHREKTRLITAGGYGAGLIVAGFGIIFRDQTLTMLGGFMSLYQGFAMGFARWLQGDLKG